MASSSSHATPEVWSDSAATSTCPSPVLGLFRDDNLTTSPGEKRRREKDGENDDEVVIKKQRTDSTESYPTPDSEIFRARELTPSQAQPSETQQKQKRNVVGLHDQFPIGSNIPGYHRFLFPGAAPPSCISSQEKQPGQVETPGVANIISTRKLALQFDLEQVVSSIEKTGELKAATGRVFSREETEVMLEIVRGVRSQLKKPEAPKYRDVGVQYEPLEPQVDLAFVTFSRDMEIRAPVGDGNLAMDPVKFRKIPDDFGRTVRVSEYVAEKASPTTEPKPEAAPLSIRKSARLTDKAENPHLKSCSSRVKVAERQANRRRRSKASEKLTIEVPARNRSRR